MPVILWGERYYFSPYVFSAYVALKEKGVPFEEKTVDVYADTHRVPEYQASSITGRVPSFEHDGFWIAESSAIVEYIDETFVGPPLLPRDAKERARARQVMAWIRSDLLALRDERSTATMFFVHASKPLSEAGEAAAKKLVAVAERLVGAAAGSAYDLPAQLFSTWSIADADLAFMLHRLILNGYDVPKNVREYAELQWRRPSVRAYVDHARPDRAPNV